MREDTASWLAMACFLEGVEPESLSLPSDQLVRVAGVVQMLRQEDATNSYYQCLEALANFDRVEG